MPSIAIKCRLGVGVRGRGKARGWARVWVSGSENTPVTQYTVYHTGKLLLQKD